MQPPPAGHTPPRAAPIALTIQPTTAPAPTAPAPPTPAYKAHPRQIARSNAPRGLKSPRHVRGAPARQTPRSTPFSHSPAHLSQTHIDDLPPPSSSTARAAAESPTRAPPAND